MASWYATATNEDPTSDRCGSDWNIVIDGRLSRACACVLASNHFKKYSEFQNQKYCGFRIARVHAGHVMKARDFTQHWG